MSTVSSGRYELGDEIASGGQGSVFHAYDRVLNRDVAVKVLRAGFAVDSAPARRFREEARITGQLQHPGIPPIHDLGTLPDSRPFLAMKLIRGRTLAQVLDEQPVFTQLLPVFEQICQAVAYAHDRHVIHRDLKPANVMVGAFGEVQVMDWGLAKLLGEAAPDGATEASSAGDTTAAATEIHSDGDDSSHTRAGSVLGTPAYMPPEQAIGAIDQLDARSDVFGLGAILCVLLTGKPPYVGADSESTRQMAARVKLDDAWSRLDACGAENEWISLCKRCLAPEKADRPKDAAEVAAAVAGLRTAAEARARQAELDRVRIEGELRTAELKATELRRRRRIRLALFGSIALIGVAVAGGGLLVRQQRLEREVQAERARASAEQLMSQVPDFQRRSLWADAIRVLDESERLLGPDALPELRSDLERSRNETLFLRKLEDIHFNKAVMRDFTFSNEEPLQQYEQAFNGCYLFTEESPNFLARDRATIVSAIRNSRIKDALVAAMDDWTFTLTDTEKSEALLEITAEITQFKWRKSLDPFGVGAAELERRVRAIPHEERTPAMIGLLGSRIRGRTGVALIQDGLAQFPSDFWLHLHLAFATERKAERTAALRAAIALRPDAFSIRIALMAVMLDMPGESPPTMAEYRAIHEWALETHRLWPNEALSANYLGATHGRLLQYDEAASFYRKAVSLEKGRIAHLHWNGLGLTLRNAEKWTEAAEAYRSGIESGGAGVSSVLHSNLADALLVIGRCEEAAQSYKAALRADSSSSTAISDVAARVGLGAALFELGRNDDAEVQFRIAERRSVEHSTAYLRFLMMAVQRQRPGSPLPAHLFQRLQTLATSPGGAASVEAAIAREIKQAAEESRKPRNLGALYAKLGEARYANQMPDEAEQCFLKALEHDPKSAYACDWVAFLKLLKRDAAGALPYAEQSVKLDPKLAQAQFNLGRARLGTRDVPGGIAALREAQRLDPRRADVKQLLDLAEQHENASLAPPPREIKR
ncbi:MAG: serine/threonine-protein kinase [Gemmataceae bacterium]